MKFCEVHQIHHEADSCLMCVADPIAAMLDILTTDDWLHCPICESVYEPHPTIKECPCCHDDPNYTPPPD